MSDIDPNSVPIRPERRRPGLLGRSQLEIQVEMADRATRLKCVEEAVKFMTTHPGFDPGMCMKLYRDMYQFVYGDNNDQTDRSSDPAAQ